MWKERVFESFQNKQGVYYISFILITHLMSALITHKYTFLFALDSLSLFQEQIKSKSTFKLIF